MPFQPDHPPPVQPTSQADHDAWGNIRQSIAKAIDGGETVFSIDSKPVNVCQNARAAKVAAFTMLQYFNLLNHKPIGQVK